MTPHPRWWWHSGTVMQHGRHRASARVRGSCEVSSLPPNVERKERVYRFWKSSTADNSSRTFTINSLRMHSGRPVKQLGAKANDGRTTCPWLTSLLNMRPCESAAAWLSCPYERSRWQQIRLRNCIDTLPNRKSFESLEWSKTFSFHWEALNRVRYPGTCVLVLMPERLNLTQKM